MSSRDLLVEVFHHVCASQGSRIKIERVRKEPVRFGKMVAEMLKVYFSEDEIKLYISTATRARAGG